MLRIGSVPATAPIEEPNLPDPTAAPSGPDPSMDPGREPRYSMDKVPQENAGYMGPEMGPFKCGNCDFFDQASSDCHIVAGKVDAEGCCNMFTKLGAHQPDEDEESPEEEASESPEEEAAEPEEQPQGQ